MNCRHCHQQVSLPFLDLGSAPPSNAYLTAEALLAPETWFPLRVLACEHCWLVQTEDHAGREALFTEDYAYFSSTSASWLTHAATYVERMTARFRLDEQSHVIEIASNDGYLLQYVAERGIPCLGIEPTASTARAAREKAISVIEEFFGVALAERLVKGGKAADLTAANNVLAHVPDINDFVAGFVRLLKPDGVSTFEFPHLLRMVRSNQFDTVYHEHYSYLSLSAVETIFRANGLMIFDVEELSTHGGSLRVFAQRADTGRQPVSPAVARVLDEETRAGVRSRGFYEGFQQVAECVKDDLLRFLLEARAAGKRVAAYGAAAKGNTLMNFAGIRPDLIEFVVDRAAAKAGRFMPGSRIPIVSEQRLSDERPDYIVLLPWNLRTELETQLAYARDWGAQFVVAVPHIEVF